MSNYSDELPKINNIEIDNSKLHFEGRKIHIDLCRENLKANYLEQSFKNLCRAYPKFRVLQSNPHTRQTIRNIVRNIFLTGVSTQTYIRNITISRSEQEQIYRYFMIRPFRFSDDFLGAYMPLDRTILFRGVLLAKTFYITSFFDIPNTECMNFEVDCKIIPCDGVEQMGNEPNFLNELYSKTVSLAEYTRNRLDEWIAYLNWRQKLVNAQVFGCKFYKWEKIDGKYCFYLVTENKEEFHGFKKHIRHDVFVYDNN